MSKPQDFSEEQKVDPKIVSAYCTCGTEEEGIYPPCPLHSRLFYIQDMRSYTGNSVSWWMPDGNGYTCDLDKAWKVTEEKARSIMRHRPDVDKAWPCDEIDALAQRHFDMQRLRGMVSL